MERGFDGPLSAGDGESEGLARVLLVDDEPFVLDLLRRWLASEGYESTGCTDIEEAWTVLGEDPYPLVIADITMPGGSGLDLLDRIKARFGDEVAVLMATAVADRSTAIECLRRQAYGYLIKPLDRTDVLINVESALDRRRLALQGRAFQLALEEKVRECTLEVRQREQEIIWRLLWMADRHDKETSTHFRRIGLFAQRLAARIGWEGQRLENIKLAAAMHDIGKIGIPEAILRKRGPLTDSERKVMQEHTVIGGEILGNSNIPLLQLACEIALCHHERWDGSGYPRGLAGTDIPEGARIVSVVDVYDALGSDRNYRKRFPEEQVLAMMREERGKHFDPFMLDAFLEVQPEMSPRRDLAGHARGA